jgi:hypothetical protein
MENLGCLRFGAINVNDENGVTYGYVSLNAD